MEALSSIQRLGGDVELAVGLSTIQHSRVFEVVNKIQIHAPLELSVMRRAAPLELSPLVAPFSPVRSSCSSQSFSLRLYCEEPATLLLILLALLYLHITAPHPAPSNTLLHITSQALYARECSRPSAPPRSSSPSSCTALPPSAPRAPHNHLIPRAPPHAPRAPPHVPRAPPHAPRAPPHVPPAPPHVPRAPPHVPRAPPHVPRAP